MKPEALVRDLFCLDRSIKVPKNTLISLRQFASAYKISAGLLSRVIFSRGLSIIEIGPTRYVGDITVPFEKWYCCVKNVPPSVRLLSFFEEHSDEVFTTSELYEKFCTPYYASRRSAFRSLLVDFSRISVLYSRSSYYGSRKALLNFEEQLKKNDIEYKVKYGHKKVVIKIRRKTGSRDLVLSC